MYTITGVTGHVGSVTAQELLDQGAPVRAVVRDEAKAPAWERRGAQVVVADFGDRAALAAALRGSAGAFVMLPTVPAAGDAEHRGLADSIAGAVGDSGVGHAVMLSSIGADLAEGTGPVRWLHHLEDRLRRTGVRLTALRPPHFQEKVETVLPAALDGGIYPVFGEDADVRTPMIATRDIGKAAAAALLAPPPASETVDLLPPEYTEREVAERLAAVLGKPLQVVTIPQAGWIDAMLQAGLPAPFAHELAALYAAEQHGLFHPRGDRQSAVSTEIDETLRHVVGAATGRPAA
ncbi:NAD-dependent epimerase/dehydratase family protein [Actinomadura sp. GC306]|uniref:NAD(P)H-binding protein n=1 Tax=Actinomadura sp. GC306 TaxID=2530367 RepID=UPI00104E88EA|nr:NAD(P)H-binding protein [Actinomadura sp. GC306]TDC70808.1 NAD-dependent epimerase/dehydratase family protein [Actinomadura sp. GC306]